MMSARASRSVGEALLDAAAGDTELARELAFVFLEEMPLRLQDLRAAAGSGNALGVQAAAHTLKGSASTLGFGDLAKCALALETRGRSGTIDPVAVEVEIANLAQACEAATQSLEAYLGG